MIEQDYKIHDKFCRGSAKPIAQTVGELKEILNELPNDLPVMEQEGGAALVVYNVGMVPFLAIEDGDDWDEH